MKLLECAGTVLLDETLERLQDGEHELALKRLFGGLLDLRETCSQEEWKGFARGAMAAMVSGAVTHPIDLGASRPRRSSPWEGAGRVAAMACGGWVGGWADGSVVLGVTSACVARCSPRRTDDALRPRPTPRATTVKVRMQLHGEGLKASGKPTPGMLATAGGVLRAEGPAGLYKGLTASLLRQGTFIGAKVRAALARCTPRAGAHG